MKLYVGMKWSFVELLNWWSLWIDWDYEFG